VNGLNRNLLDEPMITCDDVFEFIKANQDVSKELSHECSQLIEEFYQVLDVQKNVHEFFVTDISDVRIVLDSQINLGGSNCLFFQDCRSLQLYSVTLGSGVDYWICSIQDDVMKILADSIANCFMDKYIKIWLQLEEDRIGDNRFTRLIEFGCELFSMEEMDKLREYINPSIHINDYHYLTPTKSLIFVVGVTSNLDSSDEGMNCDYCNQALCSLRKDDRCFIRIHSSYGVDSYQVKANTNLYRFLVDKNYNVGGDCGGNGTCGKCKLVIEQIGSSIKTERLACQFFITYDINVFMNDNLADNITNQCLTTIKEIEINEQYGFAIDIGTTTLQVALVNINQHRIIDQQSAYNPQRVYGTDVISRIQYTIDDKEGLTRLNQQLIRKLNQMCGDLVTKHHIKEEFIKVIYVVGNTVMEHIFTNSPIKSIGFYPYQPFWNTFEPVNTKTLGLLFDATLYVDPIVSGFIGGDIVSGLLMVPHEERCSLYIDLGTNGEIVVVNNETMIACSTATGPAFEGGNIECGMVAITGAITKIEITEDSVSYQTVESDPVGLCGSGIISCISELRRVGMIDKTGLLHLKSPSRQDKGERRFYITDDVYLSQKDIRNIQLSKGAIRSGIEILLKELNIDYESIHQVFIGGAFGNAIDIQDLISIGIIPRKWEEKVKYIGNSALAGAIKSLNDPKVIHKKNVIASTMKVIDLSQHGDFLDFYVKYMDFE
jgi:uncharacterized 2Fe-2S/4Fe-4S cluster protein (DUF4445 family)